MSSDTSSSDPSYPHVNVWASARRVSLRRADSSPMLLSTPLENTSTKPSFARRSSINSLPTDIQVAQETNGSSHSYSHAERAGFSSHINQCFQGDPSLAHLLPLNPESDDLFARNSDGLILCKRSISFVTFSSSILFYFWSAQCHITGKLLNLMSPGAVDWAAMNTRNNLNIFQKTENVNAVLKAAQRVGIHVVNIGSKDIMEGRYAPY